MSATRWFLVLGSAYAALTLQLAAEGGTLSPNFWVAALVWGLAGCRPAAGVGLAALLGALADLAAHDRAGLQLAVSAITAWLTTSLWNSTRPWWGLPTTAFLLDFSTGLAIQLVADRQGLARTVVVLELSLNAALTAGLVAVGCLLAWMARRLASHSPASSNLLLQNRWRMLAE